ncbi:hypothetical protein BDZ97DRAFT_1912366 [Flammula alnicola]|nr:hypothetical protein BDZ97DRAFT_1912366 [Flammula alnicola]
MDEVFWSNVVKRWSDASENVIKLKKELAKVQEERTFYRNAVDNPRKLEDRGSLHFERVRDQYVHEDPDRASTSTIRDELQDAELGLGRAKEEYRRLQHDLAVSSERIKKLTSENEKLSLQHWEEVTELREEYQSMLVAQKDWHDCQPRSGNCQLLEKTVATDDEMPQQSESHARVLTSKPPFVLALERQIEALKQSVQVRESENQHLRNELTIAEDKLHKAEENTKILLASIVKMQAIARHSAHGTLHPISNNLLHSDSGRSSRRSFSSNHSRLRDLQPATTIKSLVPVDIAVPAAPSQIDDKTVIEHDTSSTTFLLPPEREKVIAKFATVSGVHVAGLDNSFDREFLKHALGEGVQSLIEHLAENQEKVDKTSMISSYLCPTLNHHPWCPSTPGQHGFIFVGLGKEKDSYRSPVTRNLFVGLPKSQTRGRSFRYLGKYRVNRVQPLTVEEWNTLSREFKLMYAKLSKDKGKDTRPLEDILLAYENGELLVPCVQLQCISFDDRLFASLVSHRKSGWKT